MLRLLKLEMRCMSIKTSLLHGAVLFVVLFLLLLLMAYAPNMDPSDKDLVMFKGYEKLIPLYVLINICCYGVLSAVMHSRYTIEAFKPSMLVVLFSYPVPRHLLVVSKIALVSVFASVMAVLSSVLGIALLVVSDGVFNYIGETLSAATLVSGVQLALMGGILVVAVGLLSLALAFSKRSVPTAIITSVVIGSFVCNIGFSSKQVVHSITWITVLIMLLGSAMMLYLLNKVNSMDAV